MTDLEAALATIERLQAACVEYRAELSEQDATIKQLQAMVPIRRADLRKMAAARQRREQLLREWVACDARTLPDLVIRTRAELGMAR